MDYLLHVTFLVLIYSILAVSLDLIMGQIGILSLAQAAFFGIGAYTSATIAIRFGADFLVTTALGILVSIALSTLLAAASLRLKDDYFILGTFGFNIILSSIENNATFLTGGAAGLSAIPRPSVLGFTIQSGIYLTWLAALFAIFSFLVAGRIASSPFGRVLRAIREDEVFVQSLGKYPIRFKVHTYAVSAGLASIAGSLYAYYIRFVDPTSFTVDQSILLVSMVILGGADSRLGAILGALLLVTLPEALRLAGLSGPYAANVRQIAMGAALVCMMMLRPKGLVGRYAVGHRGLQ